MIIVLGHLVVDPADRDRAVELSADAVRQARSTAGCLDFAVAADPVDDGRVNVAERWVDRATMEGFRGAGVEGELARLIQRAEVEELEVRDA